MSTDDPIVVAVDCETWLTDMVHPEHGHMGFPPLPVCWSIKKEGKEAMLIEQSKAVPLIRALFRDTRTLLVFHHLGFDVPVAMSWCGVPASHVYAKLDVGMIRDTYVREKLIGTATGDICNGGHAFDLASCLKRYTGEDKRHLKKGADVWRTRYNELDGLPVAEYPSEAYDYAIGDAEDTLRVFNAQENHTALFENDEHFQTQANFVCGVVGSMSPFVDTETVDAFAAKHTAIVERAQRPFIKAGFLRWNKRRHPQQYPAGDPRREGWSEVQSKFESAVEQDYQRQGKPVPRTDPSTRHPMGKIKQDQATLLGCESRALRLYGRTAQDIKLVNAFVPSLKASSGHRVTPSYNFLVSTGRMSCVKGDTKVLVKRGAEMIVEIQDIQTGELVWTHKERWRRVTATMVREEQEMAKVVFSTGQTLTCTAEHRLLTSANQWALVGDFINEHLTILDELPSEPRSSKEGLQDSSASEGGTEPASSSPRAGDHYAECHGSVPKDIHTFRDSHVQGGIPVDNKEGQPESYVDEEGQAEPQAQGGLRRRAWVQDKAGKGQESFCTSKRYGESLGPREPAKDNGRAPHRREPTQQPAGQFGTVHEDSSSCLGAPSGPSITCPTIQMASDAGLHKVYDITVDEDESYYAAGVFNHNCRKPNQQQLPRAAGARECFKAAPGHVIVCIDFDSFEMFGLAQILFWEFNETRLLDTLNANQDPHLKMSATLLRTGYKEVVDLYHAKDRRVSDVRQLSKIVNFGAAGGMGADTFLREHISEELRGVMAELNPHAPLSQVMRDILEDWKEVWGMHQYFQWVSKKTRGGRKFTYTHPWSGRIRGSVGYTDGCNLPFQGICADAYKAQAINVMREILSPGTYLHEKGVELGAMLHDENLLTGPPDTARKWATRVQNMMCESARQVMPDCKIRAGAEVTGTHWRKSGVDIRTFEHMQRIGVDCDQYLDARNLNGKLSVQQFASLSS